MAIENMNNKIEKTPSMISSVNINKGGEMMNERLIDVLKDINEFITLQAEARSFRFVPDKGKLEEYKVVRDKIRKEVPYLVLRGTKVIEMMKHNFITWPEYVAMKRGASLARLENFETAVNNKYIKVDPVSYMLTAVKRHYGKASTTLGSASMTRASKFFALTGMSLPEFYEIAACGAKFYGKEVNIAKASARIFANMSSGNTVGFAKLHGNDVTKIENEAGIKVDVQVFTVADYVAIDKDGNKHTLGDGLGFLNDSFMAWAADQLGLRYMPVGAQVRIGGAKSFGQLTSSMALRKILADNGYDVKTIDFTKPVAVFPASAWKFDPSWPVFPVTILRTTEPTSDDNEARTTYQLINALKDGAWIPEIAKETLKKILSRDPQRVLKTLGLFTADDSDSGDDNFEDLEDVPLYKKLFEIVKANPEKALAIPAVRKTLAELLEKKAKDVARGRFIVNGAFLFMALDENIFMNKVTGKTEDGELILGSVEGHLNEGEVATPFSGNVVAARFPLATPNEPKKLVSNNTIALASGKEVKVDQNIIYFNAIGFIWEGMSGADFDGDSCLVTTDKRIFDNVMEWPGVPDLPKVEGAKVVLDERNMIYAIKNNMIVPGTEVETTGGKKVPAIVVGQVAIWIAGLLNQMHSRGLDINVVELRKGNGITMKANMSFKDALAELYGVQNYSIDYAKTGYMPVVSSILGEILPEGRVSFALPGSEYKLARKIARMLAEGKDYAAIRHCDVNRDSEREDVLTFAYKTELAMLPILIDEHIAAYKEGDIASDYNTCAAPNESVLVDVVNTYELYKNKMRAANGYKEEIAKAIETVVEALDFLASEHDSVEVGLALLDVAYIKEGSAGNFVIYCGYRHLIEALKTEDRLVMKKNGEVESVAGTEITRSEHAVATVKIYAVDKHAYKDIKDSTFYAGKTVEFKTAKKANGGLAIFATVNGKVAGIVSHRDGELEVYRASLEGATKKIVGAEIVMKKNSNNISFISFKLTNADIKAVANTAENAAKTEAAADSMEGALVMKLEGDRRSQIIQASFAAKYAAMANKSVIFIATEDAAKILDCAKAKVVNDSVKALAAKDPDYHAAYMTLVDNSSVFGVRK